jgi:hypothetical protein
MFALILLDYFTKPADYGSGTFPLFREYARFPASGMLPAACLRGIAMSLLNEIDTDLDDAITAIMWRPDLTMTDGDCAAINRGEGWYADPLFRELWMFHVVEVCGDRDELTMPAWEFAEMADAATYLALEEWKASSPRPN